MDLIDPTDVNSDEKSLVILQSLLCLLRSKNLLSRADIEELKDMVERRAADHAHDKLHCCEAAKSAAAKEMAGIDQYLGQRYGGKHRRLV